MDSENVLVGVAALAIREPNDALADWSTVQKYAGDHSVKLYKGGSGDAGSTHLELSFPTPSITLTAFVADPTDYSFWYHYSAVTGNFVQFELKFEDPDSDAWAEVTVVPHQNTLGIAAWLQKALALTDKVGWGGVGELGASFFDWDLGTTIATIITDMDLDAAVTDCGPWLLKRVRLELWEATPERTAYVDSLEVDGTVYTVEPGGTVPGLSLSSPYVDVGYTEDGVTLNYAPDVSFVEVEEETMPIGAYLAKEVLTVVCNMAESSLVNLGNAIGGSVRSGNKITIGAGVLKEMNIRLTGLTPGGFTRSYFFPRVVATGAVGMSYRRAQKTIVPLTLSVIKPTSGAAGTFTDNAVA